MFDIEYKGGNTVVISTKQATLVADPRQSLIGLKDVMLKNAIEVATEGRFQVDNADRMLAIEGPGEYEVAGFSIRGVAARRHIDTPEQGKLSTVYRIEVGDVRIALLGNIAHDLEEDQLEAVGVIDILVLPVGGGGYTLDATAAATLVRAMEPKLVIPVHYADDALSYEVPQDTLSTFVTELGAPVEATAKLKVKSAASLPAVLSVAELSRS